MRSSVKAITPMERLCLTSAAYATPEGYYDVPYTYARSYFFQPTASQLVPTTVTLGADYKDSIALDGDSDFIVRKVGTNFAAACGFNFEDALSYNYFSQPLGTNTGGLQANFPFIVSPEKMYPSGGAIKYTLPLGTIGIKLNYGIAEAAPYVAYFHIYFQGVKRFRGIPNRTPGYPYWERMYTYIYTFNLNYTYLQAPYTNYIASPNQLYSLNVNNYDFELMQVGILPSGTDAYGYEIQLLNADQDKTSNAPLSMQNCVSGCGSFSGGYGDQDINNGFPVPSLLYPANGIISFYIRSLADTTNSNAGGTETIYFKGVERIPC